MEQEMCGCLGLSFAATPMSPSDIDFLVDMEPNRNLLDLGALLSDLRELMDRRVDVVSEKGIYWLLRRRILKEAKPL
jgi:uncharacterized protein